MTRPFMSRAALMSALAVALATPVAAQDTPAAEAPAMTADTVVARVGDVEFTMGHVLVVRRNLPAQVGQLPDEVLFEGIIEQLIDQHLLSEQLASLENIPVAAQLTLENERRALDASVVLSTLLAEAVDDAAVQAAYDEAFGDAEPGTEYNASHILVETEEEAREIIAALEGGADFGALAEERSGDPSAQGRGGSLGWFGTGMMVPEFENAVVALEPGTISEPVETQFGWHVVRLNETRDVPPPALEEVRAQLVQQVQQQAIADRIAALREAAGPELLIEGIDPSVVRDDSILPE